MTGLLAIQTPEYFSLDAVDAEGETDGSLDDDPAYLTAVCGIDPELEAQARAINPGLFYDYSRTQDETYLMNHCRHCEAKIGDHYVFKAEGPLMPFYDEDQQSRLVFVPISKRIGLESASETQSSFLDELLQMAQR